MSEKEQEKDIGIDNKDIESVDHLVRMARIGNHLSMFVCLCVARKKDPRAVLETLSLAEYSEETKPLPVVLLWKWIQNPSTKNLNELSESFGVDFKKTAQKISDEESVNEGG